MKLIVTGVTGFAGGEVLKQALADEAISEVTVLTRRATGLTHAKLKELILEEFLDYSKLDLHGFDACIWCLGVPQGAVNEADYIKITSDYAVNAAVAMWAVNPSLRFCFVSGRSADPTEKARALYSRIKGRTEKRLAELSDAAIIFRPGFIAASKQSGPRKDLARFAAPIAAVIGLFIKDFKVECDQLARCLLDVAKHGTSERVLANHTIRDWVTR